VDGLGADVASDLAETYVEAMLSAYQMLMNGRTAIIVPFPGQPCTSDEINAVMAVDRDSAMWSALSLRFYYHVERAQPSILL
jgi:hypothetical protein